MSASDKEKISLNSTRSVTDFESQVFDHSWELSNCEDYFKNVPGIGMQMPFENQKFTLRKPICECELVLRLNKDDGIAIVGLLVKGKIDCLVKMYLDSQKQLRKLNCTRTETATSLKFTFAGDFGNFIKLLSGPNVFIICKIVTFTHKAQVEVPQRKLKGGLVDDLLALDTKLADITIKCGNKEIKAHKMILCARSPVFFRMLDSDMIESKKNLIEIEDFSPEIVEKLVKFIYSDRVSFESSDPLLTPLEVAKQLYQAADKYEVENLVILCQDHCIKCLTRETAVEVLIMAEMHGDKYLKDKAVWFIGRNAQSIP